MGLPILFEVIQGFVNSVERQKTFHPDIELGLNKPCIIEAAHIHGFDPGTPGVVSENKGSTSLTELLGQRVSAFSLVPVAICLPTVLGELLILEKSDGCKSGSSSFFAVQAVTVPLPNRIACNRIGHVTAKASPSVCLHSFDSVEVFIWSFRP